MSQSKPVLLAVSFGSSDKQTGETAIAAVEAALRQANPEYELRRAFTSRTIIDIIERREKVKTDSIAEAMRRIVDEGIGQVIIQPTHVIPGKDYSDVIAAVKPYADKLESIRIGAPLLADEADYDDLAAALEGESEQYSAYGTAIVFMGHGTRHASNGSYSKLQKRLFENGCDNCFIGTVAADPTFEAVMELINKSKARKVILLPLTVAAGVHVRRDMAGDSAESWKSRLEKAGYEVECILKGLGEYSSVQQMFVNHAANAKQLF